MGRVSLAPFGSHSLREACATLEELTDTIREAISGSKNSQIAGCTSCELSLSPSAVIPLIRPSIGPYAEGGELDLPAEFKTTWEIPSDETQQLLKVRGTKELPAAAISDIVSIADPTQRSIVQRAASRGIEASIEVIDGFRYSFNNAWASKDQDGFRFSYICQDSMQNKDRHANGHARTLKQPTERKWRREVRKPTYDCKGSISVKYSVRGGRVEVFYRHFSIHPTVEERKTIPQLPQPPKVLTQSLSQHLGTNSPASGGGLAEALREELSAYAASPAMPTKAPQRPTQASNVAGPLQPLKRKRDDGDPVTQSKAEEGLSLAELLMQTDEAQPLTGSPPTRKPHDSDEQAQGVQYDLPSWERPPLRPVQRPLPPARPPHSAQAVQTNSQAPAAYQPPHAYQHQQQQRQQARNNSVPDSQSSASQTKPSQGKWRVRPPPHPQTQPSTPTQLPHAPQGLFMTLKAMPPEQAPWHSGETWHAAAAASPPLPPPVMTYSYQPQPYASRGAVCANCGKSEQTFVGGNGDRSRPVCGDCLHKVWPVQLPS